MEKRMVFFHTRRLAKQFNMTFVKVGQLLSDIGAKKWTTSSRATGTVWYWEEE